MPEDAEEAAAIAAAGGPKYPTFWAVIGQITVLDLVFSLDSVITAIGLTDPLAIMIAALLLSVAIMTLAAVPLARFVLGPPNTVLLALPSLAYLGTPL